MEFQFVRSLNFIGYQSLLIYLDLKGLFFVPRSRRTSWPVNPKLQTGGFPSHFWLLRAATPLQISSINQLSLVSVESPFSSRGILTNYDRHNVLWFVHFKFDTFLVLNYKMQVIGQAIPMLRQGVPGPAIQHS
jgi:hypothetical protein